MTRQLVLKQVIVLFYLLFCLWPVGAAENFANLLFTTSQQQRPTPHFSQHSNTLTVESAYQTQRALIRLKQQQDTIAGYKAGLTSIAGQEKFKVDQALTGVLFTSGLVIDSHSISLSQAGKPMLETELGFILSTDINTPLTSIEQLKTLIDSIAAVIELPDIGYESPAQISGLDLIAANVAADRFIIGEKLSLEEIGDVNLLSTSLSHESSLLFNGVATDALGDQWRALLWMINQLVSQGYRLSAGEILITGALGKMVAAEPGHYQANFGPLGRIEFDLIP